MTEGLDLPHPAAPPANDLIIDDPKTQDGSKLGEAVTKQAAGVSFRERLKGAASRLREEFGGLSQMPQDEIQDSTVAYTIWQNLHNPVSNRLPGEIPFTIRDVMANAGYVTMRQDTDYRERFPEVYQSFRKALADLSQKGVLEMAVIEDIGPDGESVAYYIPNDESGPERQQQLIDIAKKAAEINPNRYR